MGTGITGAYDKNFLEKVFYLKISKLSQKYYITGLDDIEHYTNYRSFPSGLLYSWTEPFRLQALPLAERDFPVELRRNLNR